VLHYILSDPVILESKSSSAVRPACCSLPVDFHPAASDHQPSSSRDQPHHVWHQHYGDSSSEAAMAGSDIDDGGGGGPGPAVDVSPPAAGEFVDLNATRCSTALLLLHPPDGGGGPGPRFASPPFCDSRRHPLQLANRTLVLIPAAPPASLTAHWFWNLLLPSSDTAATSAATGGPDRPPAALLLLLAVAMSLVLGCGRGHHWVVSCCFFVS
jgi:hypothetical protein